METMIADRRREGSGDQKNMSQAELIQDKKGVQVVEESFADSQEGGGSDLTTYFSDEKPVVPIVASDNKIIFSHSSKFIKYWSNTVILLAMYNSVTIPMAIFYAEEGPSFI